jgi:two-component system, cell cycle sensor histidine kinase and response regulator CckA
MILRIFNFAPIVLMVLLLGACSYEKMEERVPPKCVEGVLDLTRWDFEKDGIIDLSGEYAFWWMQQINPEDLSLPEQKENRNFVSVPGLWNDQALESRKLSGDGYATYRLQILLGRAQPLAFRFFDMATAYTLFLNGKEIFSGGVPGKSIETTIPQYTPQVINFFPETKKIDMVLWISNFHHRKGGPWSVIQLGTEKQIRNAEYNTLFMDLLLFSVILFAGFYHIALFILRNRDSPSLYFGIFCLFIALRFLAIGEIYLVRLIPGISWQWLVRLEYLGYYAAVPAFGMFLRALFREEFSKGFLTVAQIIGAVFCVTVLITPVKFFSHTVPVYNVFTLLCCIYAISLLIVCSIRKREGANILLAGFVIFFVSILNDIFENVYGIQTVRLLPFGLSAFIFSITVLIASRFSNAFKTVDLQRLELGTTNEKYRKELKDRIRAEASRRELEEKLARAQKMEALGVLAGGVAHDLNNMLSGIVSYPDLLLLDIPPDSPLRKPLEVIKDSGLRATAVVQDLLSLARRGVADSKILDLNAIVTDYLSSPEHLGLLTDHSGIQVKTDLAPHLFLMKGSEFHLKKTVMNLVRNAAEAQPKGGCITISTENRNVENPIPGYEEIKAGTYAVLCVSDQGVGIVSNDLKRIFEPFYTRKVMGKSGTGLGMAVVWGTVRDHNGFIDIESRLEKGTRFEIYFPKASETAKEEPQSPTELPLAGNQETILVVDDEPQQRLIATGILDRLGYRAISVESGEKAVAYLKSDTADLVLLDMIMEPGMDGLETFQEMIKVQPDIKAIIASGYSETKRVKQAFNLGVTGYIKKPYTLEELGLSAKTQLDGSPRTGTGLPQ